MKSTTLLLSSLLATAAIAQPHRGHLAKHHQKPKRADAVEWITDWVTETEVVGYTTTIWVSEGYVAPTASAAPTTTSATTSSSNVPAQFFQGATKSASTTTSTSVYVAPVPTSTSTSVDVAPTTSTTPVYVAPVETTSAYVAPVVETTSSYVAPVVVPTTTAVVAPVETTTAAPVVVPTTTAAAVAVAAATTSAADPVATSSGETAGGCTSGSPCAGDITHYDTVGLGACGYTDVDGDTQNVVAMPVGLMGALSNSNPMCGLYITVKSTKTGKHTTARVVDKCMGCVGNSIDLGNKAFGELDDMGVGRETATWWWN